MELAYALATISLLALLVGAVVVFLVIFAPDTFGSNSRLAAMGGLAGLLAIAMLAGATMINTTEALKLAKGAPTTQLPQNEPPPIDLPQSTEPEPGPVVSDSSEPQQQPINETETAAIPNRPAEPESTNAQSATETEAAPQSTDVKPLSENAQALISSREKKGSHENTQISWEIVLKRPVTEKELRTLAAELRAPGYQNTFIGYYLPNKPREQGYWATTNYYGDYLHVLAGCRQSCKSADAN